MEFTDVNDDEWHDWCRELTFTEVGQALLTLKMNPTFPHKCTVASNTESGSVLHKPECDCCRLRSNLSSRSFLPLARRGRPHFVSRSHRSLCTNCTEIKRQQQLDIVQNHPKLHSNQVFQITINLSLSPDEQHAFNNDQYQAGQMLVWKINTSDGNSIDLSYDATSLNESERKTLIEETIRKLQVILNSRSTTIADTNTDHIEFTYRTLQTTMNILSSSSNHSV